jgi:hypothetical protein
VQIDLSPVRAQLPLVCPPGMLPTRTAGGRPAAQVAFLDDRKEVTENVSPDH